MQEGTVVIKTSLLVRLALVDIFAPQWVGKFFFVFSKKNAYLSLSFPRRKGIFYKFFSLLPRVQGPNLLGQIEASASLHGLTNKKEFLHFHHYIGHMRRVIC